MIGYKHKPIERRKKPDQKICYYSEGYKPAYTREDIFFNNYTNEY